MTGNPTSINPMMQKILVLTLLFASANIWAQTKFEKGYFIDNQNIKVECLIKNLTWKRTPSEFVFKLAVDSTPISASAISVREFGISQGPRFISALVKIDRSCDDERNLSDEKDPVWSEEKLFLMVLIDGEASLYQYKQPTIERYFYKVKNSPIQQLVYKRFLPAPDEKFLFKTNVLFRQQLWMDVRSKKLTISDVEKLGYNKNDLLQHFTNYNIDTDLVYHIYSRKKEKPVFHFRLTPGLNYTTMAIDNRLDGVPDFDFGGQFGFRLGAEAELIIPYTNHKFGIVFEPTYQYFNSTKTDNTQTMYVHLNTVEFPVGLRYFFFLQRHLKIFLDGFFIPGLMISPHSDIQYEGYNNLVVDRAVNFAFGSGLNWERFGAEIRFYTNRDIINTEYLSTKYFRYAVILGFRLF